MTAPPVKAQNVRTSEKINFQGKVGYCCQASWLCALVEVLMPSIQRRRKKSACFPLDNSFFRWITLPNMGFSFSAQEHKLFFEEMAGGYSFSTSWNFQ